MPAVAPAASVPVEHPCSLAAVLRRRERGQPKPSGDEPQHEGDVVKRQPVLDVLAELRSQRPFAPAGRKQGDAQNL